MNNRKSEQLMENVKKNILGLDDFFYFGCNSCGKCCSHTNILLSAYDVYCLARYLNTETKEIICNYCAVTIGHESRLPVVYIQFKDGGCTFLNGRKCSVHKAKPFVCAAYPLGRAYFSDEDKVIYFQQTANCSTTSQRHSVRKWIYENRDMEEDNEAFKMWTNMLNTVYPIASNMQKQAQTMFGDILVNYLYIGYDMGEPFLSQFEVRFRKVDKLAREIASIVS